MSLGGPLTALVVLGVLVWVGMGVSTATLLRRAGVAVLRAWVVALVAWPAVLLRIRRLSE
jgi:hypothetical protein